MKLQINITKDILQRSSKCGTDANVDDNIGQNCAIGLAIVDLFGLKSWVEPQKIIFYNRDITGNTALMSLIIGEAPLPIIAREFITHFDASNPSERVAMDEFSFEVDIPENIIDSININQVLEVIKNSSTLDLVEA